MEIAKKLNMAAEPDDGLMLYIGAGTPEERAAAFSELYGRHGKYLYNRIAAWCRMNGAHMLDTESVFHDVMWDIYNKSAASYEPRGNGDANAERANLRAWMGTSAENAIKTQLKLNGPALYPVAIESLEEIGKEPFVLPADMLEDEVLSEQMILLVTALETLSDKEQAAIRLLWLEKDWRKPAARLNAGVTRKIASALGTTPENLRQIYHRAMKKLLAYVSSHTEQGAAHGTKR